jgi:hypothetical protein
MARMASLAVDQENLEDIETFNIDAYADPTAIIAENDDTDTAGDVDDAYIAAMDVADSYDSDGYSDIASATRRHIRNNY